MAATWGPRWDTVQVPGSAVRRVVRERVGTAGQPGGTWPYLAEAATMLPPSGGNESGTDKRAQREPPPWPERLGLSLELIQKRLRQRVRARGVARRAGQQQAEDVARRGAQSTTTAADVVAYRQQQGWSQRQLAAQIGVSRGLVAECERGKRGGAYALRVREWVDGQTQGDAGRELMGRTGTVR